ncbi:MAG: hypothetical protein HY831_00705 [Candidatus Aenigmarchaeota archaeon]|nr:hypothetical protein [Candidatus Aenigmarchaeota archaeon]
MNYSKIKEGLTKHVIDTTGIMTEVNPVCAAVEIVSGMSVQSSMEARIFSTYLNYLGLGYVFARGRDLSRYVFGVSPDSPEKSQTVHDALYTTAATLVLSPAIYAATQTMYGHEIDMYQIGKTTIPMACIAFFNGVPIGYAVDTFRDLTGIEECKRPSYPPALKRQVPKMKKVIVAGLIATSLGAMSFVYSLAPHKHQDFNYITQGKHRITTERPVHRLEKELYFE